MGGPSVRVPLEPEVYDTIFTEGEPDNLWPVTPDPRQHTRRSLYLLRKRNVRLPMLVAFDAPDMMSSCAARGESVHALQALTLMNSDFMLAAEPGAGRAAVARGPGTSDGSWRASMSWPWAARRRREEIAGHRAVLAEPETTCPRAPRRGRRPVAEAGTGFRRR